MANDLRLEVTLDGQQITIDPTDIDGVEWRDIKQATGLTPKKAFEAVSEMDMEALAALVWVVQRRDDEEVQYDEVLSGLNIGSFIGSDDDEQGDEGEAPFDGDGDSAS